MNVKGDTIEGTDDSRYNVISSSNFSNVQLMYTGNTETELAAAWQGNEGDNLRYIGMWQELRVAYDHTSGSEVVVYADRLDNWVTLQCLRPEEVRAFAEAASVLRRGEVRPVVDDSEQIVMRGLFRRAQDEVRDRQCPAYIV